MSRYHYRIPISGCLRAPTYISCLVQYPQHPRGSQ